MSIMVRPYCDQAKLLFLCFLRPLSSSLSNTSAFATTSDCLYTRRSLTTTTVTVTEASNAASSSHIRTTTGASSLLLGSTSSSSALGSTAATSPPSNNTPKRTTILPHVDGHISLRLATRLDVTQIGRCNLATLPENYSPTFYTNHMRRWPDLALVAEHFPAEPEDRGGGGKRNNRMALDLSNGRVHTNSNINTNSNSQNGKIIGYVLGKVEPQYLPTSTSSSSNNINPLIQKGHVTSLAILSPYRRRGLAATLMDQLHHHMSTMYDAGTVGLHVRVSNGAAKRLYVGELGYVIRDVIGGYYQDGEDAYFMEKDIAREIVVSEGMGEVREVDGTGGEVVLDLSSTNNGGGGGGSSESSPWRMVGGVVREYWSSRRRKSGCVWEDGPVELRLPRDIPLLTLEQMEEVGRGRVSPLSPSSLVTEMDGEVVSGVTGGGGDGMVTKVEFEEREEDDDCQVMTGSL